MLNYVENFSGILFREIFPYAEFRSEEFFAFVRAAIPSEPGKTLTYVSTVSVRLLSERYGGGSQSSAMISDFYVRKACL